jgi:hypothetical protein
MVALRYNKRNSFSIPLSTGDLVLYPGVNLAVNDHAWAEAQKHPITQLLMERGILEPLVSEPTPRLDIEGIPVIDRPDEPVPAMPVGDRSAAKVKPKDK